MLLAVQQGDAVAGVVRDLEHLQGPAAQVVHKALGHSHPLIVLDKVDSREAGIGNRRQRDGLLRHVGFFKVAVVGGVVEMAVGVDDVADRFVRQGLEVAPQVASPIACVDGDGLPVPRCQIGVVPGA